MKFIVDPEMLLAMVEAPQPANVLFVDVETTSNDQDTCEIIDLSLLLSRYPGGQLVGAFNQYILPEGDITPEASGVHDIIKSDLLEYPTIETVRGSADMAAVIREAQYLCSHNSDFDLPILRRHIPLFQTFDALRVFDTMRMARRAWPELPDHKLASLRYRFNLCMQPKERERKSHAASTDTSVCKALFDRLLEEAQCQVGEELIAWSQARIPVENITFGKYKGTPYAQLAQSDPDYLQWLYTQDWLFSKFPSDYATIEDILTQVRGESMGG